MKAKVQSRGLTRGLIKPGLGHCYLRIFMFTLYRIAFGADTKSYSAYYEHLSDMWFSTLEIGAAQLHFVTEIAQKSSSLCVNIALPGMVFVPALKLSDIM